MTEKLYDLDELIVLAKSSLVHFKGTEDPGPLEIPTTCRARFLRIGLQTTGLFHLNEIEVYDTSGANIAPDSEVSTSSLFGGNQKWAGQNAVNGQRAGRTGFHTDREKNPWALVDLGQVYDLSKIVIFNRNDGSYIRALSLRVDVSSDGEGWSELFDNYSFLTSQQVQGLDETSQAIIYASVLNFDIPRLLVDTLRSRGEIELANTVYKKINGCIEDYGVSFSHHGFVKSFKLQNLERKRRLMSEIHDVISWLDEGLGILAFISSGTLLGAIRDNELIGHDDDIDLCYIGKETDEEGVKRERKQIEEFLRKKGCRASKSDLAHLWCYTRSGFHFDLFPGFVEDGYCSMNPLKRKAVRKADVLPLRTIEFMGTTVSVPNNPEEVLKLNFGEGWRTPDPSWVFDWSHVSAEYGFLH